MSRPLPKEVEVIIHASYGAFRVSAAAVNAYNERSSETKLKVSEYGKGHCFCEEHRDDQLLVQVVKELGAAACARGSRLIVYRALEGLYSFREYGIIDDLVRHSSRQSVLVKMR